MIVAGVVVLASLYLSACVIRWLHGRHYGEGFSLAMGPAKMSDSLEYMRLDPKHKLYERIILAWALLGIALLIGGAYGYFFDS